MPVASPRVCLPAASVPILERNAVMHCDLETSIPDWMIDYPETTAVFKRLGIDAGCEGKSLEYVCRQQGLDPRNVFEQLVTVIEARPGNA